MYPDFIQYLLTHPHAYPHQTKQIELVETHISWVLLAGAFAYKIKKPVNFGFLDYTHLAQRKFYCEEELRLNRRLAPDLYLALIALTGSTKAPRLNGTGVAFEYAVKMLRFPQENQLDRLLSRQQLSSQRIDELAQIMARFHQQLPPAAQDTAWGEPSAIYQPAMDNFTQLGNMLPLNNTLSEQIQHLQQWTVNTYQQLKSILIQRKQQGFIRECHGDMHLGNITVMQGKLLIFDGIEFNAQLHWIDVCSELAFTLMDLQAHGEMGMARRLLNAYLSHSGDYAGLKVLRFYLVYRAMVRAKVYALQAQQAKPGSQNHWQALQALQKYLNLAEIESKRQDKPALLITYGVSGSGKSYFSQQLLVQVDVIVLRSDVVRKRLFQNQSADKATLASGMYSQQATQTTYEYLEQLCHLLLNAGFSVLVDATFLQQSQRQRFAAIAKVAALPFYILDCQTGEQTCRQRIEQRLSQHQDASDATPEVLKYQLQTMQTLTPEEQGYRIPKLPASRIINLLNPQAAETGIME
ncbi:AAA family ATPase [Candidatus Venteria ishoeyi]|uniref:bifunctional aminoglycoside phosphotransferase/ATP-binding protein n=1 Tax=Candidatus Venteria ishoeyi TaxID=1899563 RepID=UPI0025A635A3|nr:bifunctional aminoglycoside phosphotransferase/ATP-binding protein [Candidatus Venteria ishoeyi]MDM8545256.1 AAA family ATPase [Candidatus Venteria ishoeyi]